MTSSGQSLEQRPLSTERDTNFRELGIFSEVPDATQQPTAMQMGLSWHFSLTTNKANQFQLQHAPHTYPAFPIL